MLRSLARASRHRVDDLWIHVEASAWDWRYGIATGTSLSDARRLPSGSAIPYEPLRYAAAHVVLREVETHADDVLIDVGCGKGRMLCLFARRGLKTCVGVEHDPRLAAAAIANVGRARGLKTPIDVRVQEAALADYTDATIVFFYNPFGAEPMERCLARIRESHSAHPRPIRFIYVNPIAEQVFHRAASWLKRVRTFEVPYKRRRDPSTVAIWETR